jgi:hypothetical protein
LFSHTEPLLLDFPGVLAMKQRGLQIFSKLLAIAILVAASAGSAFPQAPSRPSQATQSPVASVPDEQHKGIDALRRAQNAFGGYQQLQSIHDITRVVELLELTQKSKARETVQIVPPDAIRLTTESDAGKVVAFCDDKTSWAESEDFGLDDHLPNWQLKAAQQDLFRELVFLLQSDHDPSRTVRFVKTEVVEGKSADVIEISAERGGTVRLWIDTKSGDVAELQYPRIVQRGEGPLVSDFFSDYRLIHDKLRVPFKIHTLTDGQPYMDTAVVQIQYNTGLRVENLRKPSDPR